MKEFVNFNKSYDNSIHSTTKFEDSTSNMIDHGKFDLPTEFLNNLFNGKKALMKLYSNTQN